MKDYDGDDYGGVDDDDDDSETTTTTMMTTTKPMKAIWNVNGQKRDEQKTMIKNWAKENTKEHNFASGRSKDDIGQGECLKRRPNRGNKYV